MNPVKNESIIKSSIQLFMSRGYHETQMNEIAKDAQVSKRTLYKYYKNKSEVYFAVLCHFMSETKQFYKPEYHSERDFLNELERMAREKISFLLAPDFIKFSRIFMIEQSKGNHLTPFIAEEAQKVRSMLANWIQRNIDDGKFSTAQPVHILANYFHQSIEGMVYWPTVMGSRNGFSPEEIDSIVYIVINTFKNEPLHRKVYS